MNDAAEAIERAKTRIAQRAVELTYEALPEYARALDAIGRERCEEDAGFHVRTLVGAVAASDTQIFADYAGWCAELLAGYGVDAENLGAMFRATAQAVRELAPAAAVEAERHLEAGVRALG